MAGGPEPQPVPNDTAQIKAEVQAEIDAADTPAKKVDLAKKLIEDLKDKETHAKEVISEETDIKAGQRLMPSKQIETAQVFKSVLRAAEAAKKGIPVAKDNAQKLLAKLADQSLTPSTAAAIEVSLLDYFTGKKDLHFSKTGQPKTDFEKDFERLKAINPLAAELIARSIIDNPSEFGLTEDEAKEKFRVERIRRVTDELSQLDYSERILYERLDEKQRKFYLSLSSAEKFKEYCGFIKDTLLTELSHDSTFINASTDEKNMILAKKLCEELKDQATSIVYTIYSPLLKAKKEAPLQELERQKGTIYSNAMSLFSTFEEKFTALAGKAENLEIEGINFVKPKREKITRFNPDKNEFENFERILPDFTQVVSSKDFILFLRAELSSERSRIYYGFNLEFLTRSLKYSKEHGLMGTIKEYAGEIESSAIDEIFADESGEMVQKAISLFDLRNEEQFALDNWRKNPTLTSEYFNTITQMTQYVEDYMRRIYHGKYEEWEIDRAIFNAKLIIYGMYFKPMLWFSYADPYLTGAGTPTYAGEREMGLAIFDPASLEKRFIGSESNRELAVELCLKGVDFMPMNYLLRRYRFRDWQKFMKAWEESFQKGKAAFYDLVGDDFRDIKLFIDIGNITGCGGIDSLSGWRLFLAYEDWIRNYIDSDDKVVYTKDNQPQPQVLVEMWKRLENIGLDVLENFIKKFIESEVPKRGEILKDQNKLLAIKSLFGFLYDRYLDPKVDPKLNTGLGEIFLRKDNGQLITKQEFVQMIEDLFTNKKMTKGEKIGKLNNWIYSCFTVIMFERMPLKFVLLEKQRLSQNGVTLLSELKKFADGKNWNEEEFEQTITDLILVQTELRVRVNRDMDILREIKAKTGDDRNLFGDLNNIRSEVNRNRGYVLNEEIIQEILGGVVDSQRIERAIEFFHQIKERLKLKPSEAEWERNDPRKNARSRLYVNRLKWFKKMYEQNQFGFSPTSGELALRFINFSSSGADTIKRAANFCYNTAENIYNVWTNLLGDLRKARLAKDCKDLFPKFEEMYEKIEGETGPGEIPNKTLKAFLQKVIYFFRKDDVFPGTGAIKDLIDWGFKHASSFAEEDAGGAGMMGAWEMTVNDIIKFVSQYEGDLGRAILPEHPSEPVIKKVKTSEHLGLLGKILNKLGVKELSLRDYVNEVSGKALKYINATGPLKIFERLIMPKVLLLLLIIAIILGWKAGKDYLTTTIQNR